MLSEMTKAKKLAETKASIAEKVKMGTPLNLKEFSVLIDKSENTARDLIEKHPDLYHKPEGLRGYMIRPDAPERLYGRQLTTKAG